MIKKLIASALTLGVLVGVTPNMKAYAYTKHTVTDYSQYLGQTVNTNGNTEGWYKFNDGTWGYYIENGKLIKDSQLDFADGMYVIGEDGRMVTGWFTDYYNYDYFFNSDGRAQKGWLQSDGYWYYFDNEYHMQTGWQLINQKWYYFDETTGVMATNVKIGDYYVTADGSLQ